MFIALLIFDSADDSKSEYLQEKQRVEQSLEELTQVINALEYNITALYPLHNEEYVLPHTINLTGNTCNFGGISNDGEDYDFLFSGPVEMCAPDSPLYQEAYRRLFIAPSMAYFSKSIDQISSIYFLSKDKFIISSPKEFAQSIKGDTFDSVVMNRPYWVKTVRNGLSQQRNRIIYTGEYEDYLTGLKVVTITKGVYVNDEFKGVLAIDAYLDSLIANTSSGYQLSSQPGPNLRDLVSFTFSEPVTIQEQFSGLYLNVDEPKRIHIIHIINHEQSQLMVLLLFYALSIGAIWYRYTQATQGTLRELAMRDPLTSLSNRRGFEERLKDKEELRYIGIGVFDIDDFKGVNDEYGHEVGDQVICHIGALITDSLRQCDIVARFGGEEFVVAVSGESDELISSIFERIQRDVSLQGFRMKNGEKIQITVSGGIHIYAAHLFENLRHLWATQGIRKADEALYTAKSTGKNKVCISSD
ncbi:sensor domain-containing diguanylate cyclase [Vibrio aquaticus]|uniref:diguanylate cyclase n=1 Tax=Vibrio aquaticus TaxID=2496559 RepID=A0A432CS28_9VIBR|nr:sensor domain-containing diguanylate cyclase [Vibrio aquaticus]RTZ13924.1 sensor domain-containing diguanylate cyclase [Vibrio aquaticus]